MKRSLLLLGVFATAFGSLGTAAAQTGTCLPPCRKGFVCVDGQCVAAAQAQQPATSQIGCLPKCRTGFVCVDNQCVAGAPAPSGLELAPRIDHQPVTKAVPGQPVTIRAVIAPVSGKPVFEPTVLVRVAGVSGYTRMAMRRQPPVENLFVLDIPAQFVSSDFDYYIEAFDEDGNGPGLAGSAENPLRVAVAAAGAPAQKTAAAARCVPQCRRGYTCVDGQCRADAAVHPVAAAPPKTCATPCEDGFICVDGSCVSACTPPCRAGQVCTGSGFCATPAPPPPPVVATTGAQPVVVADAPRATSLTPRPEATPTLTVTQKTERKTPVLTIGLGAGAVAAAGVGTVLAILMGNKASEFNTAVTNRTAYPVTDYRAGASLGTGATVSFIVAGVLVAGAGASAVFWWLSSGSGGGATPPPTTTPAGHDTWD